MCRQMSPEGYVEPEDKMKYEQLMYSKIRPLMYGVGVLARSATSGRSNTYWQHIDVLYFDLAVRAQ